MTILTLNVNGKATTREVAPEMLLIDFLRETLGRIFHGHPQQIVQ